MNTTVSNTKTIEFATPADLAGAHSAPWESTKHSSYKDLVLKPEHAARRFKFPVGTTWFRIVPALHGSRGWMLGVHTLNYKGANGEAGGRHAHPKTLTPGAKSTFDVAYAWCKSNRPGTLYCKANMEGYRLLTDPMSLFWILVEEDSKIVARLVLASGYDGSRGGVSGLGHQIWKLTQRRDEDGNLVADPVDAEIGFQVGIEKTQPQGGGYPSYALHLGRATAPVSKYLDQMKPAEIAAIVPIEDVVHRVSADEEWQLLENVIDAGTVASIRAAKA